MSGEEKDELEMHRLRALGANDMFIADAREIRRAAIRLHNLDTANCNGGVDDDAYSRRESRTMRMLNSMNATKGMSFEHQSDPRGPALYCWMTDAPHRRHAVGCPFYGKRKE